MSDELVTVAAVQLSSDTDKTSNVATATRMVHEAADQGAAYVQLPEYFNYLGPSRGFVEAAESVPGPTTDVMAQVAATRGIHLHLGSLLERSEEEGKCFNTSVVLGPDGQIVATYRKAHLFDVDVPGEIVNRESDAIAPGTQLTIAMVGRFQLGLSICFDVRFPEMYRELAVNGAQVFAIPAAFNASTGRAHWDVLVRSRAIENHAFVVAAAQCGVTSEGITTFGHTMIVDPWGGVIAMARHDRPEIVTASINLDDVAKRRSQISVMKFRRPSLYSSPVRVFGPSPA